MEKIYDDNYCFVCGKKNNAGLRLSFTFDNETKTAEAKVTFPKQFQGWANIVHGGLVSTVLDEIMAKTAEFLNFNCVTAEMKIKFVKPAKIQQTYRILGKINEIKKNLVFAQSRLTDLEDNLIASSTATLFMVKKQAQ